MGSLVIHDCCLWSVIVRSVSVQPCNLVHQCLVRHCQVLHFQSPPTVYWVAPREQKVSLHWEREESMWSFCDVCDWRRRRRRLGIHVLLLLLLLLGFPYSKLITRTLYLQVFDYDRFSRDDPIGEVCLPLAEIDLSTVQTMWKTLQPCKGHVVSLIFPVPVCRYHWPVYHMITRLYLRQRPSDLQSLYITSIFRELPVTNFDELHFGLVYVK